jgi:hypothetical protein
MDHIRSLSADEISRVHGGTAGHGTGGGGGGGLPGPNPQPSPIDIIIQYIIKALS